MKKVLVVSYYFPPAGGPGVQRWLKFVKYLRDYDVEPVMFIPRDAHYPMVDESLSQEIPDGMRIYRAPIIEPNSYMKTAQSTSGGFIDKEKKDSIKSRILTWIRANLFIPDARCLWIRPSVKRIVKILKDENIDTIITTAPPHSVHMIGLGVKKRLPHIKWIADFRDPWTKIDYFHNLPLCSWAKKKHYKMEREVLAMADDVICVTPSVGEDYRPMCGGRMHVITNGYDTSDMPSSSPLLDDMFTITHAGSINAQRNPNTLWRVLGDMCREDSAFASRLKIQLAGTLSPEVFSSLKENGLVKNTIYHNYLPHDQVIKLQHSSRLLLMLMYRAPHGKMFIVGKLFEYLASRRPILAIGYSDGDAARIINDTHSGDAVDFDDYDTTRCVVEQAYKKYMCGDASYTPDSDIEKYSRRKLTERLAGEIILA